MITKTIIKPAKAAPAVGPYNHAVRFGNMLFCAGQIPLDPATGNLVNGDIKAQTERVLENVKTILDDQKLTFEYELLSGKKVAEELGVPALYDLWVRIYRKQASK